MRRNPAGSARLVYLEGLDFCFLLNLLFCVGIWFVFYFVCGWLFEILGCVWIHIRFADLVYFWDLLDLGFYLIVRHEFEVLGLRSSNKCFSAI